MTIILVVVIINSNSNSNRGGAKLVEEGRQGDRGHGLVAREAE